MVEDLAWDACLRLGVSFIERHVMTGFGSGRSFFGLRLSEIENSRWLVLR